MDMDDKTMNDDLLLQQFFSDAAQQTIADDGFTERVMQRLPQTSHVTSHVSTKLFNRLWTAFCILVFAVLFMIFNGWELLTIQFEVMLRTLAVESFSVNLQMLAAVLFGLLFVGVGEAISYQRVRR